MSAVLLCGEAEPESVVVVVGRRVIQVNWLSSFEVDKERTTVQPVRYVTCARSRKEGPKPEGNKTMVAVFRCP